jgi:hypothetical protein
LFAEGAARPLHVRRQVNRHSQALTARRQVVSIAIGNRSIVGSIILAIALTATTGAQEQPAAVPAKQPAKKPPAASWNPFERAQAAARRTQSANNLKQIMLALHNYHGAQGRFPAAYSADKEGKPLLSWRVSILPMIEQGALYKEFHLDEPWDSEDNKKLLGKMPAVFKSPSGKAGNGKTNYLGIRGEKAGFVGKAGLRLAEFTDGLSNTILVVEADDEKAIEWTKPDDLEVIEKDPHAGLGGIHPEGFLAAYADGSVRVIAYSIDAKKLWAMFTRAGGEVITE